jgi:hypothetical protein
MAGFVTGYWQRGILNDLFAFFRLLLPVDTIGKYPMKVDRNIFGTDPIVVQKGIVRHPFAGNALPLFLKGFQNGRRLGNGLVTEQVYEIQNPK